MNTLVRDLQYTIRGLRKDPGTTAVILLALALGIGVNASCFITVNAIVLHPLPYPNPDRIMTVWEAPANLHGERGAVAPANFFDWKEQSLSFAHLAAFRRWDANLSGTGDPERIQACRVTPEYFAVLGFKPERGRSFRPDEADTAGARVAVVSYGFWKRRLASAPDAVGKSLSLNGEAHTIVGVMPADFNFPLENEIWTPLSFTAAQRHDRDSHNLSILGRLKPGVRVEQARVEMVTIARRIAAANPTTNENRDAVVVPILELTNNVTDRFTITLLVTAGFVLLLASANVANLLLVRLAGRRKEIAIRTALGATRVRIVRTLAIESVLTAFAAGALGLLLAAWNLSLTRTTIPAEILKWVAGIRDMKIDGTVIAFTLGTAVLTGLLCAMPAMLHVLGSASATDLNEALKESGRGGTAGRARSRLRTILAISEVTLAMVLLSGAGVMVRTFQHLLTLNPGFRTDHLLTMHVALPPTKYLADTPVAGFYARLLRGLDEVPTARSAAVSAAFGPAQAVYIEGRPDPRPGEPLPLVQSVSGRYFETLGLPLLRGRAISLQDDQNYQPVAVVSEAIARYYWPDSDPIGRRIRLHASDPGWLTVAGVSGDVKEWFSGQAVPTVYVSFAQTPRSDVSVLIRTAGDPMETAASARTEVYKVDSGQPVFDMKSMDQSISEQTSGVRAAAYSMATYAAISLLLAVMGIYAVISYSVAQRTHEIGIRMALGASRSVVLGMTLSEALRVGAIGLAIGLPVAWILIRLMSSLLYGVIRMESPVFIGMTVVLALSAAFAGYLPARRAAQVDPMTALRDE